MVEKNDKGREARRYFIAFEKQLQTQAYTETQQPKLSYEISLFPPLENIADE
jgi:phage anti-repressor protein